MSRSERKAVRFGDPRKSTGAPVACGLPGTLAHLLHDFGLGRTPWPAGDPGIRHHYIAQMILRRFLAPDLPGERLWQLDKTTGQIVQQTTKGAASVRRLYTVRGVDGYPTDHLETFFAVVEGHAAESLNRWRADLGRLEAGDRLNIGFLLALQDQRTPAGRERLLGQINTAARTELAIRLGDAKPANRSYMKDHPGASWQDAEDARHQDLRKLRDGKIFVEAQPEHVMTAMLATWAQFAMEICDTRWKLLHANDREFVIGDRPMVMHDPSPAYPFRGNGLLSSLKAQTFMPLGQDLCLRLDQSGAPLEQRTVTHQVGRINRLSYGWAKRFIYAASKSVLLDLHAEALAHPKDVPGPRPDPQVYCEEADPTDPNVGAEHPPGYPKGLWMAGADGTQKFMAYQLQYTDDPRTVIIDDTFFRADK